MDEKTMVNDILGNVKADLTAYQTAISESAPTSIVPLKSEFFPVRAKELFSAFSLPEPIRVLANSS